MNCQDHLYRDADPRQVSPALVPRAVRRRARRDRAGAVARRAGSADEAGPDASTRSGLNPMAPRQPHHAPKAKRVLFLFMAGCAEPPRAVRQQAAAREVRRHPAAAGADQGLSRGVHQARLEAARAEVQVRPARQQRHRALRAAAAPGDGRRRHRGRQGDGHRRVQPRARPDPDEHRLADLRPAEPGRVGDVRAGQRVAGPARLRRLQHGQQGAQRRQFQLGQRLPADRLPGRAVPHQRRPGAVPLQPPRRGSTTSSATASTPCARSTGCGSSNRATPRSPRGSTRTRWPSACSSRRPT